MYVVTTHAYCGMAVPHGTHGDLADARRQVARLLRRRRRQGYPVTVLAKGAEWEIQESGRDLLVPDWCGVLTLRAQEARYAA